MSNKNTIPCKLLTDADVQLIAKYVWNNKMPCYIVVDDKDELAFSYDIQVPENKWWLSLRALRVTFGAVVGFNVLGLLDQSDGTHPVIIVEETPDKKFQNLGDKDIKILSWSLTVDEFLKALATLLRKEQKRERAQLKDEIRNAILNITYNNKPLPCQVFDSKRGFNVKIDL